MPQQRSIGLYKVVWRVVQQSDRIADRLGKLHHAQEKLRAPPVALRAVVGFDLQQRDGIALWFGKLLPPALQRVDDEITGLRPAAEGQMQLTGILVDDAEGGVFLLAAHVMVSSLVVSTGLAATRVRADVDRGLAVDAHAQDARVLASTIFGPDVGEDGVGFRDFFWGFALSTGRSR